MGANLNDPCLANVADDEWFVVPVTEAHICDGKPHLSFVCPVALALRTATGQAWMVDECEATCDSGPQEDDSWLLPWAVRAWIAAFDAGEHVEPITLRVPRRFAPQAHEDH